MCPLFVYWQCGQSNENDWMLLLSNTVVTGYVIWGYPV